MRAIGYRRRGFRPQTLLTSLLDPVAYPAAEIVALYHERWELELGYDEVKTQMLEREEALAARRPSASSKNSGDWVAYNLVRLAMARVAAQGRRPADTDQLSPRRSTSSASSGSPPCPSSPGALPRRLDGLHDELTLLILRRTPGRFPRAVKIKMSNIHANVPSRGKAPLK